MGGFGGCCRDVPAHRLAAAVIRSVLDRAGLPSDAVDAVVFGHSYPTMEAPAIGRVAALDAGLQVTTTRVQLGTVVTGPPRSACCCPGSVPARRSPLRM